MMHCQQKEFFPICVFGYNRPDHLHKCLTSLLDCEGASNTNVFIFLDGPKDSNDQLKTDCVVNIAKEFQNNLGFASCKITVKPQNIGLANSVITGVTETLASNKAVIVVEDDLIPTQDFITYMNKCLQTYEHHQSIGSISGFGYKLFSNGNDSIYFHGRPNTWGWATWKDRWDKVDWNIIDNKSLRRNSFKKAFNKYGGQDLHRMLIAYVDGHIDSWGIRWAYHHFDFNLKAVSPVYSRICNDGYNADGTNCTGTSLKPVANYTQNDELVLPKSPLHKPFYNIQISLIHSNLFKVVLSCFQVIKRL